MLHTTHCRENEGLDEILASGISYGVYRGGKLTGRGLFGSCTRRQNAENNCYVSLLMNGRLYGRLYVIWCWSSQARYTFVCICMHVYDRCIQLTLFNTVWDKTSGHSKPYVVFNINDTQSMFNKYVFNNPLKLLVKHYIIILTELFSLQDTQCQTRGLYM